MTAVTVTRARARTRACGAGNADHVITRLGEEGGRAEKDDTSLAQREAQRAPSEPSAPDASDAAAAAMEHDSLEVKKKRLEGGTAQRMLEQQMRARFMDPGAHMPKFRLFTGLQAVMEAELDDAGMALGDAHAAAILGALFDDMHAFGTHFQRQARSICTAPGSL